MATYKQIANPSQSSRRTIADAIDLLCALPYFAQNPRAEILVHPLPIPSGEAVGMVSVEFNELCTDIVWVVWLPTSTQFWSYAPDRFRRQSRDVFQLDGATIGHNGTVQLADGTSVRAVELVPARLPLKPSELDWNIISSVIALIGGQDRCYRSLREEIPQALQHVAPNLRFLDCSRLRGLAVPQLKVIAGFIAEHDPNLRQPSHQKIADTLRDFGMRVPQPRPRVARRQNSAAI